MFSGVFGNGYDSKRSAVIKAAIKSRNKSKPIQPILFAVTVGALLAMLFGSLSGDQFTYLAFLLVFLTLLSSQLDGSPKYSEIVEKSLPQNKTKQNKTMEDVLSQ